MGVSGLWLGGGLLASLILLEACDQPPDYSVTESPCVPGFHQGETLRLKLGVPYDATSNYVFDSTSVFGGGTSCKGADGLTTGATVTLQLASLLPFLDSLGDDCSPYTQLTPSSLMYDPDLIARRFRTFAGVSIDGQVSERPFNGENGYSFVILLTPSMNPFGTLTERELPPLVVTRSLDNKNFSAGCFDAWVATWDPAP
jgi:hypothetical protein